MWPTIPADLSELTDDELAALLEECVRFATEVGPTIVTAEDVANLATQCASRTTGRNRRNDGEVHYPHKTARALR